jgi:hypothetical protein
LTSLDGLIRERTAAFALSHLDRQLFVRAAFSRSVIAAGEHHGVRQTQAFFRRLLQILPDYWESVLVLLERDCREEESIAKFVSGEGMRSHDPLRFADAPRTAAQLEGPREYLHALRTLNASGRCDVSVACVDIAHSPPGQREDATGLGGGISAIEDEDEFDAARARFMFDRVVEAIDRIRPRHILMCAGNAHCCRSPWYFDRRGLPEPHVADVACRMERELGLSVYATYFLPLSGRFLYQSAGALKEHIYDNRLADPVLCAVASAVGRFQGFHYTDLSGIPADDPSLRPYGEAWDGILSCGDVEADRTVRAQWPQLGRRAADRGRSETRPLV